MPKFAYKKRNLVASKKGEKKRENGEKRKEKREKKKKTLVKVQRFHLEGFGSFKLV